jgi:hypothetical protein
MKMKNFNKIEILIPTWENRTAFSYWNNYDYGSDDNHSLVFRLSLRGLVQSETNGFLNDDCRVVCSMGLHVWVSVDGAVSIDLKMLDMRSMNLRECLHCVEVLKRLYSRAKDYKFNNVTRDSDLHTELTRATDALGIKRSLVHSCTVGSPDTYAPIGIAIKRISGCIEKRLNGMRQCEAA